MTDLSPRYRTRALQAAGAGLLAAAVAWAIGVDLGHVAGLGLVVATVVLAVTLLPTPLPSAWPEEEPPTSGAGWHQVSLLAGYLRLVDRDPDRVGAVVQRMRSLAAARLARAGIGWDTPRAREVLGAELGDVLAGRRPPPVATRLVTATLDRLDHLDRLDEQENA